MSKEKVLNYYNDIAQSYDSSRFSNTYGNFIDRQERIFLDRGLTSKNTLNLGCGTGRFMEYCSTGIDFSAEMLKVAKKNFPEGEYFLGSADTTLFNNDQFDNVICFHVLMHLTPKETEAIFREVNRILKPGRTFIFDYPSAEWRKLTRYKANNWHGGNAFRKKVMRELAHTQNWKEIKRKGVLFLPVHQFPKKLRKMVFGIDQLFTKSPFKQYSSYLIHALQKNNL